MDDRGRLAQSLNLDAWSWSLAKRWPRGAGWCAALMMLLTSCAYGIVVGDPPLNVRAGQHRLSQGATVANGWHKELIGHIGGTSR